VKKKPESIALIYNRKNPFLKNNCAHVFLLFFKLYVASRNVNSPTFPMKIVHFFWIKYTVIHCSVKNKVNKKPQALKTLKKENCVQDCLKKF